jgi:hypothetical protein
MRSFEDTELGIPDLKLLFLWILMIGYMRQDYFLFLLSKIL